MADTSKNRNEAPSEMLRYLDDSLEKVLPDDEYQKLTSHDAEMAKTTSRGDFHRCFRCAEWAVELAGQPQHSHFQHLVTELKTVVHEIRDTDWAVEFGIFTPGRTITDVELAWVDDAIRSPKRSLRNRDGVRSHGRDLSNSSSPSNLRSPDRPWSRCPKGPFIQATAHRSRVRAFTPTAPDTGPTLCPFGNTYPVQMDTSRSVIALGGSDFFCECLRKGSIRCGAR